MPGPVDSPEASPGPFVRWFVRYGEFVFRYRNLLFPAVMGLVFLVFRPVYPHGGAAADRWLDALGVLVGLAGEGVRAAVVGLAYIKRGGLNKRVHADTLVVEGVFAHSRNPLYVGNLLMLLGLLIVHNNPWVYLLGGAFFLLSYRAIVAAEERFLGAKFGDAYRDYCRRVNRWLPDPRGFGGTLASMEFNWRRVVLKEYSSFTSWVVTVCLLLAWAALRNQGPESAAPRLLAVTVLALATLAAGLLVRTLKKRGILRESPTRAVPG